ncbi:carboxylesterase family protein [Fusobacterium simiae]|uniref:Carboxylic ester hydrolase n=1 Tax=Fusobacterium simiae TaxID=855 RepID=A0ABT4DH29_FUSSI|nr:carboxylesterase family protein [Fusobacterium simiae]MCY7007904.1 carboxylesterase family protein [Fusobacterium simiae]
MKKLLLVGLLLLQIGTGNLSFAANNENKNLTKNTVNVVNTNSNTIATTESGKIQGFVQDGIYTYLGVPYATAERFMPPKKLAKWDGVKQTTKFGTFFSQGGGMVPRSGWFVGPKLEMSEDSYNLNIWTPAIKDGKKRPVMVWLHGGGFRSGSSAENYIYDGKNLSKMGDVVVVSVNHRLNLLGFLDLSAYGEKYKNSANVGIMDLVASLEWVRDNIEEFGGDPNNVTIFGESGGGAKVLTLMATPAAKGLFHKAVSESGAVEEMGMTLLPERTTRRVAELTLENLGLTASNVDEIQKLPYEKVMEATEKALQKTAEEQGYKNVLTGQPGLDWAPKLDSYIPVEPVGEKYPEQAKNIPLLIGTNLTEWETMPFLTSNNSKIVNKDTLSNAEINKKMKEKYGDRAEAIAKEFKKAYPERKAVDALYVDSLLRKQTLKTTRLKSDQNGAPVYSYIFAWDNPMANGMALSFHTAEIPFVFYNIDKIGSNLDGREKAAYELARKVSQAWINFAKTGNPNVEGLPNWTPYNRKDGTVMIFNDKSEIKHKHDEELMRLLAPSYNF